MNENNKEKEILDRIKKVINDNKDLSLEIAKVGISNELEVIKKEDDND